MTDDFAATTLDREAMTFDEPLEEPAPRAPAPPGPPTPPRRPRVRERIRG